MNKNILIIAILALIITGGIYWTFEEKSSQKDNLTSQMPITNSGENPEPGGIHDMPVEPAASIARKDLASKLGVSEKSIVIMLIEDATWTDGCLGLGKAHESCLQALVPGFKVEMLAKGETYIYRTDKTGNAIRAEE